MTTSSRLVFVLSLSAFLAPIFGVGASAAPTGASPSAVLYQLDFSGVQEGRVAGWSRVGGYGADLSIVADRAENTATKSAALFFDSQIWGADAEKDGADTELFGDTGVVFAPGTVYQVAVNLARRKTGPQQADDSPFFGEFVVELYAGDPRAGGHLLGTTVSAAKKDPAAGEERLILTSRASAPGEGKIFIRLATERVRASGPKGDAYQQAEVSLVALRAVSGPGAKTGK
jgi:hypothetical protein